MGQAHVGRNARHRRVHVLFKNEVAHIEDRLQPGRVDRLDDAGHVLREGRQAPVVLQQQLHAPLLRPRQTALNCVDHPPKGVVHRVTFPRLHPSLGLDQVVEAALFAEAARVDADRRNPHLVRQIDAVQRVVDMLLAHVRVVVDKVLMDRQIVQVQPQRERLPLELLQVGVLLRFHLPVQNLHTVQAQRRRRVEHALDRGLLLGEMPI